MCSREGPSPRPGGGWDGGKAAGTAAANGGTTRTAARGGPHWAIPAAGHRRPSQAPTVPSSPLLGAQGSPPDPTTTPCFSGQGPHGRAEAALSGAIY